MDTRDKEYLNLHLLWRSEINPTDEIVIDETVFEEIYRMQEGEEWQRGTTRKTISQTGK